MNRLITFERWAGRRRAVDGDFFEVAIGRPMNPPDGQETVEACFSLIAKYKVRRLIGLHCEDA